MLGPHREARSGAHWRTPAASSTAASSAREALNGGGSGAAALNGAAGTAFDPELNAAAPRPHARSVIGTVAGIVVRGAAASRPRPGP